MLMSVFDTIYLCPLKTNVVWVPRPGSRFTIFVRTAIAVCSGTYRSFATGIILCMGSANEKRRNNATSSLIGRAHIKDLPFDKSS